MNFEKEFGVDVFTRTGLIVIGNDVDGMRRTFEMLSGIGANVKFLSGNEVREMLNADVADNEVGIYEEDAGYADTGLYTNTVMARARELGAELIIDEAQVHVEDNKVVGIRLVSRGEVVRLITTWLPLMCGYARPYPS